MNSEGHTSPPAAACPFPPQCTVGGGRGAVVVGRGRQRDITLFRARAGWVSTLQMSLGVTLCRERHASQQRSGVLTSHL